MQKIGYASKSEQRPKLSLNDPPSLKPGMRYLRGKASAFSQIAVEGIDATLKDHLSHRVAFYTHFAEILEKEYKDVISVMRSFQRDAEMRHVFTQMVTETDEEKAAGRFAELFAQAMADDDFTRQVAQIGEKYEPAMKEMGEAAHRLDDEETTAANVLSKKYGVVFKPRYYDGE